MKRPLVSIVIPTYKRNEDLIRLLKSIDQSDYPSDALEVIIVDNASDSELQRGLKAVFSEATLITPGKNVFSNAARKIGSKAAHGKYVFLLDDDNVLDSGCIGALVDGLESDSRLGMVGPVMLEGDSDMIWCAGANVTSLGACHHIYGGHKLGDTSLPRVIYGVHYFPNACMIPRKILRQVPFDDKNFIHNWAETDFGLRILAAGYQIACVTAAIDRHYIGYGGKLTRFSVRTIYDQAKSRILFRKRHLPRLIEWVKFWTLTFPASSIVYFRQITYSPQDKFKMIKLYIRGTWDGIFSPLQTQPENEKIIKRRA